MKVEEFNTLKLIHDNIPKISFVISEFVYESELQLYHKYAVEEVDELSIDDIKNITADKWLGKTKSIKFLNYSDLIDVNSIEDVLEGAYLYQYDYFVINMRK